MQELTEEEVLAALFEIAKERSKALHIDVTEVKMDEDYILERIKERRLR